MKITTKSKNFFLKAGLIYEYSGQIKISLKIYLISLTNFYITMKLNVRFFCCCHWINKFRKRSLELIKNIYFRNFLNIELLSFSHKYYQYAAFFEKALNFLEKFIELVTQEKFFKEFTLKNFNAIIYIASNVLRLIHLNQNKTLKIFKVAKLFHKIKKNCYYNKKEFWILTRTLIHLYNRFKNNIRKIFPLEYKKESNNLFEIPLISQVFLFFNCLNKCPTNLSNFSKKPIDFSMNFNSLNYKKNSFLLRKFHEEFYKQPKIPKDILNLFDSYSNFNRNVRAKLYFILKFERKSYESDFPKLVLNMINHCASIDKNSGYFYFIYKEMSRKLGLKKYKLTPSLYVTTKNFENKLINFDRRYISNLNYQAEKFYEKNKINSLLKISLILVLTSLKYSLIFKRGKIYKKIIFDQINEKKIPHYQTYKCENSNEIMDIKETLFLFYKILIYIAPKKKRVKKKFLADTISEIFFINNIFMKLGSCSLRLKFIEIVLRKKKYILAYKLLRFQCADKPYTVYYWQLLAWVEKEINFAVSKTLRFALRVIRKYPDSISGIIFAGNLCSIFGSSGYALAEFFQAFRWKSNSPFLNLSISIQYLNGSINRRNNLKGFAILLCLCFFFRYKILRRFVIQTILQKNSNSEILKLELLYNSGRILLFLGFNSLAKINFDSVFENKNTISKTRKFTRCRKKHFEPNIKHEAYFNSLFLEECIESKLTNINDRFRIN